MKNIIRLLKFLNKKEQEVFVGRKRNQINYYSIKTDKKIIDLLRCEEIHDTIELEPTIDRLKFELYGEFPLSPENEKEFTNEILPLFKI